MSEDNDLQGNEAEIAGRLDQPPAEPAGEATDEAPETPVEDSKEVMPASEPQEQEQSEDDPELAEALEGSKNPERTKSYIQKLQEENKALKQEQPSPPAEDTPKGNIFDEIRNSDKEVQPEVKQEAPVADAEDYQNLTQNQTDNIAKQFTHTDDDGNQTVDVDGLVSALQAENKRASSEALDRVEQYEQDRQSREANQNHPQLDPKSDKFDRTFYDAVKDRALANRHTGRTETLTETATAVQAYYKGANLAQERRGAVEEYKETQATRNAARPNLTGKSRERQNSQSTQEELRSQTMSPRAHESDAAISERLSRL